jgi:hypothetical protein
MTSPTPAEHTALDTRGHTELPWSLALDWREVRSPANNIICKVRKIALDTYQSQANAALIVAAVNERASLLERVRKLEEALREGRRAIGEHFAPNDCYATGPLTGDSYRDLVECPACSFIKMHDAALHPEQETA